MAAASAPRPLEGKVAAITGASSGIGEATALALARAGAAVALGARRIDRLRDLAERIDAEGGRARPFEVDVADEESARSFVEQSHSELGRLDVLVNNAGVMLLGPIEGADTEHWRRMVEVNLLGLLYCTHAALPLMREQGGGDVVNISSVAGRVARAGNGVYALTKFGVGAFSESLRQEAIASKIRVMVVEPGFVTTELQGHNAAPVRETIDKMMDEIGEVLSAEDIADAIAFAVSRPPHVSVNEILIRPTGQAR
jgi:NADP-dependent 3-hydroxy acid dehydrogenase YdfG